MHTLCNPSGKKEGGGKDGTKLRVKRRARDAVAPLLLKNAEIKSVALF